MDMVTEFVRLLPEKSRKKRRDRSNWKKEKLKQKRHKSKKLPKSPQCRHTSGRTTCGCSSLTRQDVRRFHQRFYSSSDKVAQDNFILKHTIQEKPKRNRIKNGKKKSQDINKVELFCDGCPRQNKNITVIGMSAKWLSSDASHPEGMLMGAENGCFNLSIMFETELIS
uniref:Uncharacterized protein n=1 Tax=Timema shepardi TaxID=629360 RepID=A0A7R9B655_TIMSH|nr:unnamed protein product [Timema shepardi]